MKTFGALGFACAIAAAGAVSLPAWAQDAKDAPKAPELASHRAVYQLSLGKTRDGRGPNSATGKINFDFSGNRCEGYAQNIRQSTELQMPEGPARASDLRTTTFEDGSGRAYRYKIESKESVGANADVDGRAAKADDGAVSVNLSKPKPAKIEISGDALFPTDHMAHILATARAGGRIFEKRLFDGSETGLKAFDTLTVIGAPSVKEAKEPAAQKPALLNLRRWPVTISYFEEGKKDSEPVYTLSFELYENGVSRALVIDYGDFALKGELEEIEFLPVRPCDK